MHVQRIGAALLATTALLAAAPGAARAGIWTQVDTPTTQTITAIDYQGGDRLWFTTSNAIYKRDGGSWTKQLDQPGTNFRAIEFNPSGTRGLAVGEAGAVWRFNGSTWSKVSPLLTYNHPYDGCYSPGTYTKSAQITADFLHVRWTNDTTVFALSGTGGSLLRSTDSGASFDELSRRSNGTCLIDYNDDWIDDVFVLPSNPQHMLFLTGWYGRIMLSSNGLTSSAAARGSACGDRLTVDPANPSFMYVGGAGCNLFAVSENGGMNWSSPDRKNGSYAYNKAFDAKGTTALGAGDAGYIFNSVDRREAYVQPADGAMATNDWRAVDVANASQGAVGGLNGGLLLTNQLNTVPDITDPTGSITGPDSATAGVPVTFTANVSDSGSGIDPAGFSWTSNRTAVGTGQALAVTFPATGYYTLEVTFRDRAGHSETASKGVYVNAPKKAEDFTDSTGKITGPEFAVAGEAATFTVAAADTGSGIDPNSFSWSRGTPSGTSTRVIFPQAGTGTIAVSFSDRAGNRATASATVPVAPTSEDRPKPQVVNTPKPTIKKAKGGKFTIPIKGGYQLPKGVAAGLGCKGEIIFTMKKAKTLISARSTKLDTKCKYAKSFSIAAKKVGSAPKVGITIRFAGNAWLAPVKRTYQVKVPRH
jgi:hypothetical protein